MPPIRELDISSRDDVTVSTIGTDSLFSKPLAESRWEAQGEHSFSGALDDEDWMPQFPIRQRTQESVRTHHRRGSNLQRVSETTTTTTTSDDAGENDDDNNGSAAGGIVRSASVDVYMKPPAAAVAVDMGLKLPQRQETLSGSVPSVKRPSWNREISDNDVLKMPHRQRTLESLPADYELPNQTKNQDDDNNNNDDDDHNNSNSSRNTDSKEEEEDAPQHAPRHRVARITRPSGLRAAGRATTTPASASSKNTRIPRSVRTRMASSDSTMTVRRRGSVNKVDHGNS